jgi:phage portal protein BeeE
LKPTTRSLEQLFDHHLLFDDERMTLECKFDFDDMTRGDLLTRFQAYQIGTLNGWLSRNEVRARENLNPIDDGHGDEYRVPLNTALPTDQPPTAAAPSEASNAPTAAAPQPQPGGASA